MQLEQLFVFPIASPLTSQKRLAIEAQIQENAQLFEKDVEYRWLKRGEEKFLRLVVDPATIEVVFHDDASNSSVQFRPGRACSSRMRARKNGKGESRPYCKARASSTKSSLRTFCFCV